MTAHGDAETDPSEVTRLLGQARRGDRQALDQLLPLVYQELKRLARRQMRAERPDHTLFTTGLVHEAYLKLAEDSHPDWEDRAHFFAIASRVMRQILIDHARKKRAEKRGGDWKRTTLQGKGLALAGKAEEVLALDAALDELGHMSERTRQVVEYRFYCGLSENEISEILQVTPRTVQREWVKARAWLYAKLYPAAPNEKEKD